MLLLFSFANGDQLIRQDKAIIARLSGHRQVLSTAPHLGGCRNDLRFVFNYDCTAECKDHTSLEALDYAAYMAAMADKLGLDPARSAGIMTTASMENAAICTRTYGDTSITAVVTAGIDINGGRAGDPAGWHESEGIFVPTVGTINILLFISANLTAGALTRALVTCSEAKAAALQELLAPSRYSSGIATGSGTDGTILVTDADSSVRLSEAGLHSKLGELIGRAVIAAVKEALFRQTGLDAKRQFSITARMARFGITEASVRETVAPAASSQKIETTGSFNRIDQDPQLVVLTSLYAHLLDQLLWGLVAADEAVPIALTLLQQLGFSAESGSCRFSANTKMLTGCDNRQTAARMVELFRLGLIRRIRQA